MTTCKSVPYGKPDAGNPHVRFDEGEVAPAKPRRGSLLYTNAALRGKPDAENPHVAPALSYGGIGRFFLLSIPAFSLFAAAEPLTDRPGAAPKDLAPSVAAREQLLHVAGEDVWGGRPAHPASVNAVGNADNPDILSLRGAWDFYACPTPKYYWHYYDYNPQMLKNLTTVEVPGCWEASGVGQPGPGRGGSSWGKAWQFKSCHTGSGLYRKFVKLPSEWKGRRIWLKEGGIRNRAWFWLNKSGVGMVSDNHGARKWEVTPVAKPGETNVVFIEVNNEYPCRNTGAMSYHNWGGLVRDVEFEATPQVYIDDAWVRGDFDRRVAEVHVALGGFEDAKGARPDMLVVEIEGERIECPVPGRAEVQCRVLTLPLRSFRPWSPESPNLYWATLRLLEKGVVVQTRRERFGVRKFEVRGDSEFFLNGRPYFLRGFGDDSVYPLTGFSPASRAEHRRHLQRAHEAGFNFVRTHTHVELPEYFEAADEVGILVEAELSYYRDLPSEQLFAFDPIGDVRTVMANYRRHPSLAVYSGGNEGTLGPIAGKLFSRFVRANDPDRLVVEQDGGWSTSPEVSDFVGGPMNPWQRGCVRTRPFVCHEYLNLAVKDDYRNAPRYTGVTRPLATREMRRAELAKAGLDEAWGERLQNAQNAYQALWQKNGIEHARKDPFCDGFCFWTIVDFSHRGGTLKEYPRAQGYFNQFWETKKGGLAPTEFARFNGVTCLLIDTEDRVRDYTAKEDRTTCGSYDRGIVIEETNRVFAAGSDIPVDFILSHFGASDIPDATLTWRLAASDGTELLSGARKVGTLTAGPAKVLARERLRVPEIVKPVKAKLTVAVGAAENDWTFYLVPHLAKPLPPPGIVVAALGSPELAAARAAGKNLLVHAKTTGPLNAYPNWWDLSWGDRDIVGAAAVPHALWGDFPFEEYVGTSLMRLFRKGVPLPVDGFSAQDALMITEGAKTFCLNLAAKVRPDDGREVFVSGLDIFSDLPEAKLLLKNIYVWLDGASAIGGQLERQVRMRKK